MRQRYPFFIFNFRKTLAIRRGIGHRVPGNGSWHRFPCQSGLDQIVPTHRSQGPAHEDSSRMRVEGGEFSQAVQDQDLSRFQGPLGQA